MDQFAWSKKEALYYMGLLMSVGAVVACVTFVAIGPLCKRFAETNVLLWGGFLMMILGRVIYIPWGDSPPKMAEHPNTTLISTNYTSLSLMSPLNQTLAEEEELLGCPPVQEWCRTIPSMTISQFIYGYALTSIGYPIGVTLIQTIFSKILGPRPQGVWMGFMTGSGCLSRVMGPVFVGYIYTRLGTIWTFSVNTVMMLACMIWLWIFRNRLVSPTYDVPPVEMKELNKHGSSKVIGSNGVDVELDLGLDDVTEYDKLNDAEKGDR